MMETPHLLAVATVNALIGSLDINAPPTLPRNLSAIKCVVMEITIYTLENTAMMVILPQEMVAMLHATMKMAGPAQELPQQLLLYAYQSAVMDFFLAQKFVMMITQYQEMAVHQLAELLNQDMNATKLEVLALLNVEMELNYQLRPAMMEIELLVMDVHQNARLNLAGDASEIPFPNPHAT